MIIEPFTMDDIAGFLALVATENWVAERWEFEFLLSEFPAGCFVARDESGEPIGFVTSLKHDRSGWIGNLIMSKQHRGKGIGEKLFTSAQGALQSAGAETLWLTASKAGRSLYEKYGFTAVDKIIRWVGVGRQRHAVHGTFPAGSSSDSSVSGIDYQAWGDRRDALLTTTVGRGTLLLEESGFLVLQPCGADVQFGPFSALESGSAEQIFDTALRAIPLGTKVYLDSPASNHSALRLFNRRRMKISGSNELMYAGVKPDYRPERLYGLASMGSCG